MIITDFIQALRLPFISVSVSAFIFGSFIDKHNFNIFNFLLGLISVVTTHLGANLINDYADSKSGVDWQDKRRYKFFGGSKLIQEGVLKESFYLKSAIFCFILAIISVSVLTARLLNLSTLFFYLIILFFGWSYSHRPLELSYHRLGELVIFMLFGPALVMGGYFIQTQVFPDAKSFMLSLPLGILTTAILFANEIPDYQQDRNCHKFTGVSFLGAEKAYIIYAALIILAFITIAINLTLGYLGKLAYLSFIFILPASKAAEILKNYPADKQQLIHSSKLTILVHTLVSIVLILDIII